MLRMCCATSLWMSQCYHHSASAWPLTFCVFGDALHHRGKIIGKTYKMEISLTTKRNCGCFGMGKNQILQAWSTQSLLVSCICLCRNRYICNVFHSKCHAYSSQGKNIVCVISVRKLTVYAVI